MARPQPLSGVRVVEIGDRLAASYCGKLLRDAGADVVTIERGAGDPLRRYRPHGGSLTPGGESPFHAYLNGGKRSVTAGETAALLTEADIVVVAASPAEAARLGLPATEDLVAMTRTVVTISNFGWTGPWAEFPATEFTLQAWCGSTGSRGLPDRPPVSVGGDLGEFIAGGYAAFFALAVQSGGGGVHVDLSVFEAMTASMQTFGWLREDVTGLTTFARSIEVPSIEQTKDGYVGVSMATDQQWLDFCAMVDRPQLTEVPELRFQLGRWKRRDLVRSVLEPWFRERTTAEIVELAAAHRIPMVPIGNGRSVPRMDHFVTRGTFVANDAGFRQPRPPWLMSEAEPRPVAPAPALGEADDDDTRWPAREAPRQHSAPTDGRPLQGLRIVDLTAFWAGPAATQLFAALGADVVKVESVRRPDGIRYSGGLRADVEEWWEYSWVYHGVNTDKRSVTLDLGSARGKALFERLVAGADVVIENFPARVMPQFGLGYDALKRLNERLVFARMPAFGLDGPWRDRGGFAMTMEQIAGLAWLTGFDDDVPTTPRGPCDALAAVHAAFATLCALEFRRRTGLGQLVEIPMIETVLNATALQVIEHDLADAVLSRRGNRGHQFAVQNVYACAGDERWIAVSIRDDADWAALKVVLGRPDWATGAEVETEAGRWAHETDIDAHLRTWFREQSRDLVVEVLLGAGIPAAPVVLPTDIGDNPQLTARGFLQTLVHPMCGPVRYPAPPIAPLIGRAGFVGSPAPMLGQHNGEVLGGELGLTSAELDELRAAGVIGTRPAAAR